MKKHVENEDSKASPANTCGDGNHRGSGCQMVHGRWMRLLLLSKLRNLMKFLLFMEDDPKHRCVVDLNPIDMASLVFVLALSVMFSIGLMLVGFKLFGIAGFFAAYIIASVLPIEIPHCIFDR